MREWGKIIGTTSIAAITPALAHWFLVAAVAIIAAQPISFKPWHSDDPSSPFPLIFLSALICGPPGAIIGATVLLYLKKVSIEAASHRKLPAALDWLIRYFSIRLVGLFISALGCVAVTVYSTHTLEPFMLVCTLIFGIPYGMTAASAGNIAWRYWPIKKANT